MWTPHNLALKPSSKITFPPAEKVEAWMSNLDLIILKSLSTPYLYTNNSLQEKKMKFQKWQTHNGQPLSAHGRLLSNNEV